MWRWILKQAIRYLAEPIVDAVIDSVETLAKQTSNDIDDAFVRKLREFKEAIVGFILSQSENIASRA